MTDRLFEKSHGGSKTASAAVVSVLSLVLLISVVTTAAAEQCVSNKSGFRLKVEWYQSHLVLYDRDNLTSYLRPEAIPVQADTLSSHREMCTDQTDVDGRPLVVVLSAEGSQWRDRRVVIGAEAAASIGGASAGANGIVTPAGEHIPNPQELRAVDGVFAIEIPSTTHWLDAWGTILSPRTKLGEAF